MLQGTWQPPGHPSMTGQEEVVVPRFLKRVHETLHHILEAYRIVAGRITQQLLELRSGYANQ